MNFYFGIDGGGTKSRITVSTLNNIVVKSIEGKSTNPFAVGMESACKHAEELILSALKKAGRLSTDEVFGCIGSAGLGRKEDIETFEAKLSSLLPDITLKITNDARILLEGALDGKDGIILISGTGSVCMGRNKETIVKTGGFGWRLGDEGSGWWLAKEAIRRSLKAYEKRDIETKMTDDLLFYFGLQDISSFVSLINSEKTEKGYIAKGSSIVLDYAKKGDPLAIDIIQEGMNELYNLVFYTYNRMGLGKTMLVLYGGVLENNEIYRNLLKDKISSELPDIEILPSPIHTPLEGALALAKTISTRL